MRHILVIYLERSVNCSQSRIRHSGISAPRLRSNGLGKGQYNKDGTCVQRRPPIVKFPGLTFSSAFFWTLKKQISGPPLSPLRLTKGRTPSHTVQFIDSLESTKQGCKISRASRRTSARSFLGGVARSRYSNVFKNEISAKKRVSRFPHF